MSRRVAGVRGHQLGFAVFGRDMSGCSVSPSAARLVGPKRGDLKGAVRGPRLQAGLREAAPAGRASGSTSRTGWRAEGEDPLGRQRWVKAGGLGEEPLSRPWPRLCAIFIGNSQVKLLLKGADGLGSVWRVPQGFAGWSLQGGHEVQEGSSAPRSSSGPSWEVRACLRNAPGSWMWS